MADEYMDVVYKLWESSWADDAVQFDKDSRIAFEPSRIKRVEHDGKYHKVSGLAQMYPSPQRTPVLFQAGTSKTGRSFAAKHAEAIYIGGLVPSQTASSVVAIREEAASRGRDPASLKFFVGISPIVGRTVEDAKDKYKRAVENSDPVGGLAQFSGYTGIDLSRFPLDEVFELKDAPGDNAVHSFLDNFNKVVGDIGPWTPRKLGEIMALGGFHPAPVGTPEMVADVFEKWIGEADVDGFNIAYVTTRGSHEDVVDLLVPELQKRGLMWQDYEVEGGTLRENIYSSKGMSLLRYDHYGHKFKHGSGFGGDSLEAWEKEKHPKLPRLPLDVNEDVEDTAVLSQARSSAYNLDTQLMKGRKPTSMSCFVHLTRLHRIESNIQQSIYRVDESGASEAEVDRYMKQLEHWHKTMPRHDNCTPKPHHNFDLEVDIDG
ncbi:luciferase-like domain-containing protein [Lophiotrema nucula]|uniref:Luciferase-like domain-containing protein n=1 Tax=Lophiotrema nucula TaxID=690887 RepID=A0A6A5ZID5_9PLEO|nr:luciferase-like domain-containing protein [Lophiotrema nucula]